MKLLVQFQVNGAGIVLASLAECSQSGGSFPWAAHALSPPCWSQLGETGRGTWCQPLWGTCPKPNHQPHSKKSALWVWLGTDRQTDCGEYLVGEHPPQVLQRENLARDRHYIRQPGSTPARRGVDDEGGEAGPRDPDLRLGGDDPPGGPVPPEADVGVEAEQGGLVEPRPLRSGSVVIRRQGRARGALPGWLSGRHPRGRRRRRRPGRSGVGGGELGGGVCLDSWSGSRGCGGGLGADLRRRIGIGRPASV
jgi:hypothetical protein